MWTEIQLMKLNRLIIPTDKRQTSLLYTSTAEQWNQGLAETNPADAVRAGLELKITRFEV